MNTHRYILQITCFGSKLIDIYDKLLVWKEKLPFFSIYRNKDKVSIKIIYFYITLYPF